jgi:hypothetical protein
MMEQPFCRRRSARKQAAGWTAAQEIERRQQQQEEDDRSGAAESPATALAFPAERTVVAVAAARLRLEQYRATLPAPPWVPSHAEQRFLQRHRRRQLKLQKQEIKAEER